MRGISLIDEKLLRFQERLRSTELAKNKSTSTAVAIPKQKVYVILHTLFLFLFFLLLLYMQYNNYNSNVKTQSLKQLHCTKVGPFQSDFSIESETVHLSISSMFSFPSGHTLASYVFFLVFPSVPSFLQQCFSEGSSYTRCGQSS